MKNKTKRLICYNIGYFLILILLYSISKLTNLFHFSLITFIISFFAGCITQCIMYELGWEEENE